MPLPDDKSEPIFILSCERSGSTLLRVIVDTHPDIACPAQLSLGPTCANLYNAIYYSIGQRLSVSESERIARVLREVRDIVGALMSRYASSRDKRIWCEKTTLNVDYLKILSDVFPNARYLCLYRNCMDVVQSCLKFSALGFMEELAPYVRDDPRNLAAAMAESWLDKNTKILDFETRHPGRCLRVSYEDLTLDPQTTIPAIFRFLGVSWDDGILETIFSVEHDRGEGDLKVHFSKEISRDSVGKGRSIPSKAIPNHLQARINVMNDCLGFDSLETFYKYPHGDRSATTRSDGLDLDAFFRSRVPNIISERRPKVGNLRGVCHIVVEGERGGAWTIDLSGVDSVIRKEKSGLSADCTIAIAHAAFCELVERSVSVGEIYESGRASVRGSEHLALQFAILLFG